MRKIIALLMILLAACQLQKTESVNSETQESGYITQYTEFISAFTADYIPVEGAYYPLDNKHHMYVTVNSLFETRNHGSLHEPFLEFSLANPDATGDQIVRAYNEAHSATSFQITSPTTANFDIMFETAKGTTIAKTIEIELKDGFLYLDKVKVGKAIDAEFDSFISQIKGKYAHRVEYVSNKHIYHPLNNFNEEGSLTNAGIDEYNITYVRTISQNEGEYYYIENYHHLQRIPVTLTIKPDNTPGSIGKKVIMKRLDTGLTQTWILTETPKSPSAPIVR